MLTKKLLKLPKSKSLLCSLVYTNKAVKISQSIRRVEGLVNSKTNWIEFFAELQASLTKAEDVWLDSLEVQREQPSKGEASYEVVIEGQMLVRETAGHLSPD